MKLTKEIKFAVKRTIREDAIKEAELILSLCSEIDREEFMQNYYDDKGNICCLVLDFAKKELVEQGILEQKDSDAFGKFI
jgi:hypothetical protein